MDSERIKQIQNATAYPESVSVKEALLQVWNECQQENNIKINAALNASVTALYFEDRHDYRHLHGEVIRVLTGLDSITTKDIDRIFKQLNQTK